MRITYSAIRIYETSSLVTIVVPSRFGLDCSRTFVPFGRPTTLFPRVPRRRLFGHRNARSALSVERVDQPGHSFLLRFVVTGPRQQCRHHVCVGSFRLQPAHLRDLGQLVQTEPGLVRVVDAAGSNGRLDLVAHQLGQIERLGTVADEQRPMVLETVRRDENIGTSRARSTRHAARENLTSGTFSPGRPTLEIHTVTAKVTNTFKTDDV